MADSGESIDIDAKVQMFGILHKKPFGHKSSRWQKRYAFKLRILRLVAICYLLYMDEPSCGLLIS